MWDKYKPPFKFTGTLYSVTVDVSGELIKDTEAEMRWRWRGSDATNERRSDHTDAKREVEYRADGTL